MDEFGQTVVMVTHDPVAAAFTDRVLFLADGRVVDELREPDREAVLGDPDGRRGLDRVAATTRTTGSAPREEAMVASGGRRRCDG